jgi:sec-independent protein translocase protein TatA
MRLQAWHVIVLIVAFILLFGWKNLPNAARSLGESMRVFKTEVDQMKDENAARKDRAPGEPPQPGTAERTDDRYRDTAAEEYRRLEGRTDDGDPRA